MTKQKPPNLRGLPLMGERLVQNELTAFAKQTPDTHAPYSNTHSQSREAREIPEGRLRQAGKIVVLQVPTFFRVFCGVERMNEARGADATRPRGLSAALPCKARLAHQYLCADYVGMRWRKSRSLCRAKATLASVSRIVRANGYGSKDRPSRTAEVTGLP